MEEENEFVLVLRAIEDHVFETHTVCDLAVIEKVTNLRRHKCRSILRRLEGQKRVVRIFGGAGKPDLYLPYHMWEGILVTQRKPSWLDKYVSKEKEIIFKEMKSQEDRLHELEAFERLLYATDIPLERAVARALSYMRFREVVHHENDKDREDVSFLDNSVAYLVEVKGKGGQGNKDDIEQLNGWATQSIERDQFDPDNIRGIFVLNHYRHSDPMERNDPLTPHAKRFLKYYDFIFFTTWHLHQILLQVTEGKMTKTEARVLLLKGESY